jgi:hypothetical protein
LLRHEMDELQEAFRRHGPRFFVTAAELASDRGKRASVGRIVPVPGRQIRRRGIRTGGRYPIDQVFYRLFASLYTLFGPVQYTYAETAQFLSRLLR